MIKPVVNIVDVELEARPAAFAATGPAAERYEARMGRIGQRIGARKLGYNITAVPPGKRAFPAHSHRINEEMFFVLEGAGEIHIGPDVYPLKSGDFVACTAGGSETAHQIVNTGDAVLRYLAVSTMLLPEVCEYPHSGKFGIFAEFSGHADEKPRLFRYVGREAQSIDYWDGE
jgi:uncharacterized cupin superfamily protein